MAAFGIDYGYILVYLGLLTLAGVLGRAVGAVPAAVTTPAGRILAQLAGFLVLTVPVSAWFTAGRPAAVERPPASGCSDCASSPPAAAGWPGHGRCCAPG